MKYVTYHGSQRLEEKKVVCHCCIDWNLGPSTAQCSGQRRGSKLLEEGETPSDGRWIRPVNALPAEECRDDVM